MIYGITTLLASTKGPVTILRFWTWSKVLLVNSTERKIVKKIIIVLTLVLFTSSAYAGSCPMIAKELDSKIEQVQKMRDAGMKAHEAGDHAKSEELLNKAMELFNS